MDEESDKMVSVDDAEEIEDPSPESESLSQDEMKQFYAAEKTNLGWVGLIWGSNEEKPGNISGDRTPYFVPIFK